MGSLTYSMNCSLDGYSADADGNFAWLEPTEDFLASHSEDLEDAATVLYGRRMYETLSVWETDRAASVGLPGTDRFADAWSAVPKVVFSSTLQDVFTGRTTLAPTLTPEAVERAKAAGNVMIGGPELAKSAMRMGLVDIVSLVICPVIAGGGTRALPDGLPLNLRLLREQRLDNGGVRVTYAVG
ncbi:MULTISPECIES: dihydrofolate reductase family protein [Arthrobacter]|uniref:Dihydrofolate reductase family protein n=1 Tax=Arthrobacter jinronghuae TaxID=2964609 RepID=A0ABT1NM03_9MICC|nr:MULTISPECIES: dihydrofolate reductase family protein [Arthrobacter]MCQ1948740.1 dihydrofolate reductase family protein [Arthrobacter jinronghuae]MCQ1952067.1 dihydrofolate reductase family protein [Arthrobacter sp. zg-Y238]MCQ1955789.1 dihydrofolate reductase family protein [Arthrobacter jinronghuae]UWX78447.1 dihydrofolate reductase family protein [Arthrobacter jinronghuae]